VTTGKLSRSDRQHLTVLGERIFEGLRRFQAGLLQLEVECFLLHPRRLPEDLFPSSLQVEGEGSEAQVQCGEWQLRCRRQGAAGWQVIRAGRRCEDCRGSGLCPEPEHRACQGTGLCPACDGLGTRLWFSSPSGS
jgi:hypothetical protein